MGIIKQDVVKNMDTDQALNMEPQRITRSVCHRILKRYKVKHDVRGSLDYMLDIMRLNEIPFDPPKPGPVTDVDGKIIDFERKPALPNPNLEFAEDGFPKHIGKVKGMCKERGIKFKNKGSTRKYLVSLLQDYMREQRG